jgi:hypothetical protein
VAQNDFGKMASIGGEARCPFSRQNEKRKPRLGGRRGLLNEAGIGGIIGFGNQTHEAGKGSNNNAAQAEYDRLGGVELIAEVPQILQPLIGLAGLKLGSTWNLGRGIEERRFS